MTLQELLDKVGDETQLIALLVDNEWCCVFPAMYCPCQYDDYGVIAIVMVIIAVLGIFVDSGMGVSLIQKKETNTLDFSTVFYFNIAMACVLYAIAFFAAPWIARQAPLSVEFLRQASWSALPSPSSGDCPGPGTETASPGLLH